MIYLGGSLTQLHLEREQLDQRTPQIMKRSTLSTEHRPPFRPLLSRQLAPLEARPPSEREARDTPPTPSPSSCLCSASIALSLASYSFPVVTTRAPIPVNLGPPACRSWSELEGATDSLLTASTSFLEFVSGGRVDLRRGPRRTGTLL